MCILRGSVVEVLTRVLLHITRAFSSVVERSVHIGKVVSSILTRRTKGNLTYFLYMIRYKTAKRVEFLSSETLATGVSW